MEKIYTEKQVERAVRLYLQENLSGEIGIGVTDKDGKEVVWEGGKFGDLITEEWKKISSRLVTNDN